MMFRTLDAMNTHNVPLRRIQIFIQRIRFSYLANPFHNFKHGFLGLLGVASGYTHAYCFFPKKLLEKYVKMDKNQIIVNSENNISSMEMGRQHDL